ncbi:MAG: transposase [Lentisphaeraceae bacterium]|nr:transposase [Lentisphaeraceae bacterium]
MQFSTTLKREVYLRRFLENEDRCMDNNTAERAQRSGYHRRKSELLVGCIRRGVEASEVLMTIIQVYRA